MASGDKAEKKVPTNNNNQLEVEEVSEVGESGRDEDDMWSMEAAGADCDCPGPPPEFLLPPPPRPPFLQDVYCSEDPIPDIETCDALPVSSSFLSLLTQNLNSVGMFSAFAIRVLLCIKCNNNHSRMG